MDNKESILNQINQSFNEIKSLKESLEKIIHKENILIYEDNKKDDNKKDDDELFLFNIGKFNNEEDKISIISGKDLKFSFYNYQYPDFWDFEDFIKEFGF